MRSLPWYVQANPDTFFPRCYSLCTEGEKQEFLGEWGPEARGLSVAWLPAHRTASGPEVGGRFHPNPWRCLWAGDEGRFLVGPAQGHGREKDGTGQAGGRVGVPVSPEHPSMGHGASGQMQARQGQWGTMGGALQERVWTETQERG